MTGLDDGRVARAITDALAGPGGVALVVTVFAGVPGVVRTPPRRRLLRTDPEHTDIGDWRYRIAPDGRLQAEHVVNGVAIASEVLAAGDVGSHISRALGQVVSRFGPSVIPNIDAAVDALILSSCR